MLSRPDLADPEAALALVFRILAERGRRRRAMQLEAQAESPAQEPAKAEAQTEAAEHEQN